MFDCGVHVGFDNRRRFPDFRLVSMDGRYDEAIDAVFVTHFHIDHCGALPVFTEVLGYNGPVLMATPTAAMAPLMLEDARHVAHIRMGDKQFYTSEQVKACMRKVHCVMVNETVTVAGVELTTFYAGHVLGAVGVLARCNGESVVYSGPLLGGVHAWL